MARKEAMYYFHKDVVKGGRGKDKGKCERV